MKLIALRNFRNNVEPRIDLGKEAQHDDHVHKGAIFIIGTDKAGNDIPEAEDMSKADQRTVGLLKMAGCIGDATDEKLVKRIQKEAAQDEKALAEAKKSAMAAGSPADVIQQLIAALKGVQPAKA
jgi:hypothetical protein